MSETPHTSHNLARKTADVLLATGLLAGAQAVQAEHLSHETSPAHTASAPNPGLAPALHPLHPIAKPAAHKIHETVKPVAPLDITPVQVHLPHRSHVIAKKPTSTQHPDHMPTPVKVPPVETGTPPPPPSELMNLHPEKLSVPGDVSEIMHSDVAYLPALGCSGFLIRNQAGDPIGVETAQHCSLLFKDGHWDVSKPYQPAINFSTPLAVETGDSMDNLTAVGEISQFILNDPKDNTHDQAIGVLKGQNAEEVYTTYNQNHLLPAEVAALKRGDTIYNSGWPVNQLNNPGPLKRQEFAMSVLGTTNMMVSNGEQLNVLLAAVPESKDGSECSWGNSGSEAFVLKTVTLPDGTTQEVPYSIGTASVFNDFGLLYEGDPQSAAAEKAAIEAQFGVSMDGYAGICGFAYETPNVEDGMVVANVVDNSAEIEQHLQVIADMEDKLDKQFSDPAASRNVIHGFVEIPAKASYWVKDPTYTYDADSQTLVIAYVGGLGNGGGDSIGFWVFDGVAGLQDTLVYSLDGQTAPDITTVSTGPLTLAAELGDEGFTDPNGLVIGQFIGPDIKVTGTPYIFSAQGGQLSLNPELSK